MYDPHDWYWIVAGDEARLYASARMQYVTADDAAYVAWVEAGGTATRIANEAELMDVLAAAGIGPIAAARAALDASDVTVLRCYEAGVAVPAEWAAYRKALRSIIAGGGGVLPVRPAYPAGT